MLLFVLLGSGMWQLAIPYVPNTSQVIGELEPGLTYQFRVSANNAIGISEPSKPSPYVAIPSEYGKQFEAGISLFDKLFIMF